MRRVTASEARRNWFRILDEVAAGATVVIERGGRRILLKREEPSEVREATPDYGSIIRAPSVEEAHRWGWAWGGDAGGEGESGAAGGASGAGEAGGAGDLTPVDTP